MKLSHPGCTIVDPEPLEMERTMDEQNSVQVPGQVIDTGPLPADLMHARMTLTERDLMDRMAQLRRQLRDAAEDLAVMQVVRLSDELQTLHARLQMLRQLRDGLL